MLKVRLLLLRSSSFLVFVLIERRVAMIGDLSRIFSLTRLTWTPLDELGRGVATCEPTFDA